MEGKGLVREHLAASEDPQVSGFSCLSQVELKNSGEQRNGAQSSLRSVQSELPRLKVQAEFGVGMPSDGK